LRWLIDEIGAVGAVIAVNEAVVQVVGGELTLRALHRIMNLYSNKQQQRQSSSNYLCHRSPDFLPSFLLMYQVAKQAIDSRCVRMKMNKEAPRDHCVDLQSEAC